ncbi:MAG: hypothetical protein QG672_1703 [Pseudomonadota bacterium]|nr:hypothetical protein [Pseudomonadota bacterium]
MRLLLHSFSAALVAVLFFFSPIARAELPFLVDLPDTACATSIPAAADWYAGVAAMPTATQAGQRLALEIDQGASVGFDVDTAGALHYRMAFNNVAEGWSWQPLAQPESEDYYRWKFLPLQSVSEARGDYVQEEKVGEPQKTRVEWRYDYFLAFDNPYDFYPRVVDDDAGFVARIAPVSAGAERGPLRLLALATLVEPAVAESTTFWKAIYSRPVDFTLKKRYLIARLEALLVCDGASGRMLARIDPIQRAVQR